MADFASAFLARDEITATDFEHTKSVATAQFNEQRERKQRTLAQS
jgi:hypothetical protein